MESQVTRKTLDALSAFADEDGAVPMERVLLDGGYQVIQDVTITAADGEVYTFDWAEVALDAWWQPDGRVSLGDFSDLPVRIVPTVPAIADQITHSVLDIAPTASAALGFPVPAQATGRVLDIPEVDRVLLLYLDGLGYLGSVEASVAQLTPNLDSLGEPAVGVTVYPPVSAVASAAMLTGAPPAVNGVVQRGTRKTDVETLFDVATEAGVSGVAVEGDALAFNIRNAEIYLSGDRDGNGGTDDNVLANTRPFLGENMPDLLWVHFHGIDDFGHTYGPDASETRAKIAEVDAAVGEILSALPDDTLVLIFADHGMHAIDEPDTKGNHGHLIALDMLIPMWVWVK